MIRDYDEGSGLKGVLKSLVGERVTGALVTDNTITIFFESGCAVLFRARDHGTMVLQPLNDDDTPAYVKGLIRDADARQANLDLVLATLSECKCTKATPAYCTDATSEP